MAKRKPIRKRERVRLDRRTALRLLELKQLPRRIANRVLIDLNVDPGRVFRNASLKEKWVFASTAAGRAAEVSGSFDLFSATADLTGLRHYILRPRGKKIAVKDLEAAIRKLAKDYNKHVGKLVTARLIAPILCGVHIRFDEKLGLFDLHLHCVWRVMTNNLDAVLGGIQTKFSSTWMEKKKIRSPAALVNYITTWVVDHRALQRWPDTARLALWHLNRAKLIRPAGDFAAFRKTLKGFRLVREGSVIKKVRLKRRKVRPAGETSKRKDGAVLGFVRAKIAGKERRCAIVAVTGQKRLSTKKVREIVDKSTRLESGGCSAPYSTSKTGPTPPVAGPSLKEPSATEFKKGLSAADPIDCGRHYPRNISPIVFASADTGQGVQVRQMETPLCIRPDAIPIIPVSITPSIAIGKPRGNSTNIFRTAWGGVVRFIRRLLRRDLTRPP